MQDVFDDNLFVVITLIDFCENPLVDADAVIDICLEDLTVGIED